ncbi:MAG: ATP-NAD kinase family protein [Anaerolineaceae bacterium]|nr:ATP-NAD kinase family protein [Anaerolineaceae bacterium]
MKIVGLIVNPIAGMGGSVGLKGTDEGMHIKARELGALPITPKRTIEFINSLSDPGEFSFLCAPGQMGAAYLHQKGISHQITGKISDSTDSQDTIKICQEMLSKGIEILVFVGGDGTARDVHDAIGMKLPVIAVPSGVKVFSAVFAVNPKSAAKLLESTLEPHHYSEEEVLDIDEQAYRNNKLSSKLYGYLLVPSQPEFIQQGKLPSSLSLSDEESKKNISEWFVEKMEPEVLYLFGPGTTVKAITDELKLEKNLLGVDAVFNKKLIAKDINANQISKLIEDYKSWKIIVTPIGGNGFIFGRGNKQFTPEILQKTGKENIIIVGTEDKIKRFEVLRVDMGEENTNAMLSGFMEVIVGYKESRMIRVVG